MRNDPAQVQIAMISFKEIGPSRRISGSWVVQSITVEGTPPGVRPPSRMRCIRPWSCFITCFAVIVFLSPDMLAEVTARGPVALSKAITAAVLFGTNIPTSWTTNLGAAGLKAVCTAASQTISLASYTDIYEAIMGETGGGSDGALMLIEADGFMATGHVARGHVF